MPGRAEIAKMGGDDDREDKERVMAGFLSGFVNVRSFHKHTDIFLQEHSSVGEHRLCRNGSACA